MAVVGVGKLLNGLIHLSNIKYNFYPDHLIQVRSYAARKSTRERKRKELLKRKLKAKPKEEVIVIPAYLRKKMSKSNELVNVRFDDSSKAVATDNVWVASKFRSKIYPFEEAIQCFREVLHPTMLDVPGACVNAAVEVNLQGRKKTKFMSTFTRIVAMPHVFGVKKEISVLAFCKSLELQQKALDAGASLSAGPEIISKILTGKIPLSNYQVIVAHPNILPDLIVIRGLLKKRFPNPDAGTLGLDIGELVQKFMNGVEYTVTQHSQQKDFGSTKVPIGPLDMDVKFLEENLSALLKEIYYARPVPQLPFVTRVLLECPPSKENFTLNHSLYISDKSASKAVASAEEEEEEDEDTAEEEVKKTDAA